MSVCRGSSWYELKKRVFEGQPAPWAGMLRTYNGNVPAAPATPGEKSHPRPPLRPTLQIVLPQCRAGGTPDLINRYNEDDAIFSATVECTGRDIGFVSHLRFEKKHGADLTFLTPHRPPPPSSKSLLAPLTPHQRLPELQYVHTPTAYASRRVREINQGCQWS